MGKDFAKLKERIRTYKLYLLLRISHIYNNSILTLKPFWYSHNNDLKYIMFSVLRNSLVKSRDELKRQLIIERRK